MARHTVCARDDIVVGELTPVTLDGGISIVLFRSQFDEIRAFSGVCPHQGARLEFGCVSHLTQGDEANMITVDTGVQILRCPWHGFAFDMQTGHPVVKNAKRQHLRLKIYDVEIDNDQVVVVA